MKKIGSRFWHRLPALMRNFWVNLSAVALGVVLALLSPDTAKFFIPFGNLYLSLLAMTVLPILFSAITHGLGQLFRSGGARTYVSRLLVVFLITVLLGGTVGVLGGVIGEPGSGLGDRHRETLGKILLTQTSGAQPDEEKHGGLTELFNGIIPKNIFEAFAHGRSLAVIFVSVLMGVALGLNRSEASDRLLEVVRGLFEVFFKILSWALYGLPLGLFCLIAGHIATIGTEHLLALGRITGIFYLCCGFMGVLYLLAMRFSTGLPIANLLHALRDPLALAFVSSNSLVAMPMALQRLEDDLGQSRDLVELVVPLGIVMNRHAYPLLFAFMTVFVSQVYHQSLGVFQLFQVSLVSAMLGMAAIGPAASVAPLLALILVPLGLPADLAVATVVEITALVTPMVAFTHLFGSCATATVIGATPLNRESRRPSASPPRL